MPYLQNQYKSKKRTPKYILFCPFRCKQLRCMSDGRRTIDGRKVIA